MRYGPRDQRWQAAGRQPAQPGGEQRTLTTSVFSGRSRRIARSHHRRSKRFARRRPCEHFGLVDLFASERPICSHLQGQPVQQLLTAATCAYTPARQHREPSTATQNGGALRVKQDAAPTLTCGNEKTQAGVGAVACGRVPFGAVEGRSVHPVAPNLLPRPRARDRAAAARLRQIVLQVVRQKSWPLTRAALADADARPATVRLRSLPIRSHGPLVDRTCSRFSRGTTWSVFRRSRHLLGSRLATATRQPRRTAGMMISSGSCATDTASFLQRARCRADGRKPHNQLRDTECGPRGGSHCQRPTVWLSRALAPDVIRPPRAPARPER